MKIVSFSHHYSRFSDFVRLTLALVLLASSGTRSMAQLITLSDVAANNAAYERVDDATLKKVRLAVKELTMIADELDDDATWLIHRGDLTLNQSVYLDFRLIVDGDLVVRGHYDDYDRGNIGSLIVLGDMTASHVFSWGPLAVTGSIIAKEGLVLAHYNDFTFEVGGRIEARALLIDDKSSEYNEVRAAVHVGYEGPEPNTGEMLRLFVPSTLIELYAGEFEEEYDRDWFAEHCPSHQACTKLLKNGKPIFRSAVAPASLVKDLKRALALDTPAEKLLGLAKKDPLVSAVIASRGDIPDSLQDRLIETASPLTLKQLAYNEIVSTKRLERIAAVSDELTSIIADHANAPESIVVKAATSDDPATREAALRSNSISIETFRKLAFDDSAAVRVAAIYHRKIYELEPNEIDRMVSDPDFEVRLAIAAIDGLLNESHLDRLAGDAETDVRLAVAEMLVNQSRWTSQPTISPSARIRIADKLMTDSDAQVVTVASLSAADKTQIATAREWLAKAPESEKERWRCVRLAQQTASKPTIDLLATSGIPDVINALCANAALTSRAQQRLLESRQLTDDAIYELGQNPNLSQDALTKLISRGRSPAKQQAILNAVQNRDDLSAKHLEMLGQFGNPYRTEDWGLIVLHSPAATRELVEQGIRSWYDDEPEMLEEVRSFAGRQGDDWWNALASAKHEQLREIAAKNVHTPVATLQKMATDNDDNDSLLGVLATNPKMPMKHPLYDKHPYARVLHPLIETTELESLLKQNLRDGDEDGMRSRILEILSARQLRDSGPP